MRKLLLLVVFPSFIGCGVIIPAVKSESKLSRLSIGDSREKVLDEVGSPNVVRGSVKRTDNTVLQVDEYRLYEGSDSWINMILGIPTVTLSWWVPLRSNRDYYWVQYINGKIDRWGKAGDWQPNFTADITMKGK